MGLRTVMIHNIFKFGDIFWVQLSRTAIGAPPAPMYATLYFGILEQQLIPQFPELIFYRRFIDDGIGLWKPTPDSTEEANLVQWNKFKTTFNSVSTLQWTFSELVRSTDFLDINCTINIVGFISTDIFEKAMNLHLIFPHIHATHQV